YEFHFALAPTGPGDAARLPYCRVSPQRRVFVSMDETDPGIHAVAERAANGRLTRRQSHARARYVAPYGLTDRGVIFTAFARFIYPDGREATVTTLPNWSSDGCTYDCADPRYLAVDGGGALTLFDVTRRPPTPVTLPVRSTAPWHAPGMVFTHGARLLIVPNFGEATVLEKGTVLATLGTGVGIGGSSRWWWGEDGTVWERTDTGTYHLLHWRTGAPRLAPLRGPATTDAGVMDFAPDPLFFHTSAAMPPQPHAPALAAWGEGRLLATAETVRPIPERLTKLLHRLFGAAPRPDIFRVLTLYRDGKPAGTFVARLGQPMTSSLGLYHLALYQEHLAFTGDGTHLAWVLESAQGVAVYVFATGR
ncbi:MAG TPA: hypothetical protein PK794_02760, partial [Armatimonadota bacterium]|nr:hypothetical protein [Armatimonadota bacterium]